MKRFDKVANDVAALLHNQKTFVVVTRYSSRLVFFSHKNNPIIYLLKEMFYFLSNFY